MKHIGVKLNWIIYSNRKKNLTVDEVIDYLITCIEKKNWYAGGSSSPFNLGEEPKKRKNKTIQILD